MLTSPVFRRVFFPNLLLVCVIIVAVGLVAAVELRTSYTDDAQQILRDDAQLIERLTRSDLQPDRFHALQPQVREVGQAIARRITIIADDGTVIADSEAEPATMENHRLRPELLAAASVGEGTSVRPSSTLHEDLMYYARRVAGVDGKAYYIRLATHLRDVNEHLGALYAGIAGAVLLAIFAAGALSWYLARRHARPLLELTRFADALRRGELDHRLLHPSNDEVGRTATAMNAMADSLGELINRTREDQAQLRGIVTSMSEGVIATDRDLRVVLINAPAGGLLDYQGDAVGKHLWEVTRAGPLLQAAKEAIESNASRKIQVGPIAGRHVDVAMANLSAPQAEGLVIVLHDATESVRYQELRKEFVANVSHELRTPLTVIKGYAETLREGAIADKDRAAGFLQTIENHADQLANLVNDLLELSELESRSEMPRVGTVDMGQIIQKATGLLEPVAQRKQQRLEICVASELPQVRGNADYLERAISNLLDNAIKYTPAAGSITVSARSESSQVMVEVADTGIGIPPADLPRIFERFYRVDRSRSRELGGTGLGLAIVKHVAQLHGGSVRVSSTPGVGSCFTVVLPA